MIHSVNNGHMKTLALTQDKQARLTQLIDAATDVFARRGYRQATVADIANKMRVAPGTVYLYAASKEALFDLAVRWHLGFVDLASLQLPVQSPGVETTLAFLTERLDAASFVPQLATALSEPPPADVSHELHSILAEYYDVLRNYRAAIRLIEQSSIDWPELESLFFTKLRQGIFDLMTRYVEMRCTAGLFRPVPNFSATARFLNESMAWFAMRMPGDRYTTFTETEGRAVCLDLLSRALLP